MIKMFFFSLTAESFLRLQYLKRKRVDMADSSDRFTETGYWKLLCVSIVNVLHFDLKKKYYIDDVCESKILEEFSLFLIEKAGLTIHANISCS